MIDSHCHLDHSPLYDNLKNVINRAQSAGVKQLLTICTSLQSYQMIQKIVSKFDNIYGTLGIHPHETKDHNHVDKKMLLELKGKNQKIIGLVSSQTQLSNPQIIFQFERRWADAKIQSVWGTQL